MLLGVLWALGERPVGGGATFTVKQMPEGDSVHKLAAYLDEVLTGKIVRDLSLRRHARPTELIGRGIQAVTSHGKHLFIRFQGGVVLRSHLGMYGSWHRYPPQARWSKPARQAGIVLTTDDEVYVCFNPKEIQLLRAPSFALGDIALHLGPDLTRELIDWRQVEARVHAIALETTALADLLLDQRIASGIGNVYKSEVLFLERQAPLRQVGDTSPDVILGLYRRAHGLLLQNLHGGPRVTRPIEDGQGLLWVYGREDHPCFECSTAIRRAYLGADGRSTYWCPTCQSGL